MQVHRIKSETSNAAILIALLLPLTTAFAQTPRVSNDGGPILEKGVPSCGIPESQTARIANVVVGSAAIQQQLPRDEGPAPRLETHPAYPGAEVTIETVNSSTVKYCIRPSASNSGDDPTPAPLALWLAPYAGSDLTAYSALHITNRAPAACTTSLATAVPGKSSAQANATWCVLVPANGPKPDLAVYLGVPERKAFGGNLSTGKIASETRIKGAVTVLTAGYAAVCKLDLTAARAVTRGRGAPPLGAAETLCGGARAPLGVPKSSTIPASALIPGTK